MKKFEVTPEAIEVMEQLLDGGYSEEQILKLTERVIKATIDEIHNRKSAVTLDEKSLEDSVKNFLETYKVNYTDEDLTFLVEFFTSYFNERNEMLNAFISDAHRIFKTVETKKKAEPKTTTSNEIKSKYDRDIERLREAIERWKNL